MMRSVVAVEKRPTYTDVARVANVSATTVSFVLNGRAAEMSIPESTCERVRAAARELGYRQNRLASGLAHGRTSTIGVIVPRLESSFFAHIVHGIQEAAEQQNCRLLLGYSRHDPVREAQQVDLLLEHRVDALICQFTADAIGDWLPGALAQKIPVVIVDEASYAGKVDCVVPDDAGGASSAMRHLIAQGHKRIAHIAGPEAHSTSRTRLAAYKGALVEAKLPFDPDLLTGGDSLQEDLGPRIEKLLTLEDRPTAIFAANDVRAARAAEGARACGLRYPMDIEIIGFGNLEVSRSLGLSTVDQDPQEMGRFAAARAFARQKSPSMQPQTLRSSTRLLLRDGIGTVDYELA
jgi:DNA-binding LacI/PurR family transcriptional regulator